MLSYYLQQQRQNSLQSEKRNQPPTLKDTPSLGPGGGSQTSALDVPLGDTPVGVGGLNSEERPMMGPAPAPGRTFGGLFSSLMPSFFGGASPVGDSPKPSPDGFSTQSGSLMSGEYGGVKSSAGNYALHTHDGHVSGASGSVKEIEGSYGSAKAKATLGGFNVGVSQNTNEHGAVTTDFQHSLTAGGVGAQVATPDYMAGFGVSAGLGFGLQHIGGTQTGFGASIGPFSGHIAASPDFINQKAQRGSEMLAEQRRDGGSWLD